MFWAWAVVGAVAALGFVSLGVLALLPAVGMAAVLVRRGRSGANAYGVVTGVGCLLLVVAYLQRQGPGTTCWKTATASGCDQHLDPRPWLIVGVILAAAGVIAYARTSRDR